MKLKKTLEFPVGSFNKWKSISDIIFPNDNTKNWLIDKSSLTQKIESICSTTSFSLIGQKKIDMSNKSLIEDFTCLESEFWILREVILWGNNEPWVYGHSLICNNLFDYLPEKFTCESIGSFLFKGYKFVRSDSVDQLMNGVP